MLAQPALDEVARHRVADLAADGDAETRARLVARACCGVRADLSVIDRDRRSQVVVGPLVHRADHAPDRDLRLDARGQGRVAAFEIMKGTKAIANLVRENKIYQIPSIIQTGAQHGMVLYEKYVDDLVKKGLVTMADAKSFLGKDSAA